MLDGFIISAIMVAANIYDTSVNFQQTILRNNAKDSNFELGEKISIFPKTSCMLILNLPQALGSVLMKIVKSAEVVLSAS